MKASEFKQLIREEIQKVLKEALAPADKSKLTNKVEITVAIARTLMNNAKTGKLKHMSAPGGVTHYWNPKTKEYIGRTEQEGRLNQGTFFFSDTLDKTGNLTEGINKDFDVSKMKVKDTIELKNSRTNNIGTYTIKRIFGGSSNIKEIEVLTRNNQPLTLYYSKERGLQNFKGDTYEHITESKFSKAGINESAMSDIDLMAQDAISFNAFAVEFFKEYPNIQKDEKMGFIKWLKTIYKKAKENK
jgi:hypothetical protein